MTPKIISLSKPLTTFLLASLFTLGFVITPYWRRAETISQIILMLAVTVIAGTVWVLTSSGEFRFETNTRRWYYFAVLLVVMVAINYKTLTSVIPWRGDEDYHIQKTLMLISQTSIKWLLFSIIIFMILLYLAWRRSKWSAVGSVTVLIVIVVLIFIKNPFLEITNPYLFRYPYISYWAFAALPKFGSLLHINMYEEFLFRVVPFLAGTLIVWICQQYFSSSKRWSDILWGCVVATVPLLFYYSSILYLELPAIVLMVIVSIRISSLLQDDADGLRKNAAWYALVLIGFVKETVVLFLFCFLFWRAIAFMMKGWKEQNRFASIRSGWRKELSVVLAILLPSMLYFFLRSSQEKNRTFSTNLSGLIDPAVWQALGRSIVEQFGFLLALFVLGCIVLIVRKQYMALGFHLFVFILYPLSVVADTARYAGYSRFNLFLLAPVLAVAGLVVKEILVKSRITGTVLAGFLIVVNLWISPINPDGTKQPYWGNYLADTSEHYYPYDDALIWLKENHKNDRILFTGMRYPYISFSFYFSQLKWDPNSKALLTKDMDPQIDSLSDVLAKAETQGFDTVLYQVKGNENLSVTDSSFTQEKIFQNDAHLLVLYTRK